MMFWILVAVLILIALAFVAPSLLSKKQIKESDQRIQNITIAREQMQDLETALENGEIDQEAYEGAKIELEKTLMDDISIADQVVTTNVSSTGRNTLVALLVILPLITVLLYLQLGEPELTGSQTVKATTAQHGSSNRSTSANTQMDEMIAKLKVRLEKDPKDLEGWYLLARSYKYIKDYPLAEKAYARVYQDIKDDTDLLLEYADAMIMANDGEFNTTSKALITKALKLDPTHTTALWLGGMMASEEGDYQRALKLWKLLKVQLEGDPQQTQVIAMITRLENHMGIESSAETEAKPAAIASGRSIKVKVILSADLSKRLNGDKKIYIYAKAQNGPRFPIAAIQLASSELPAEVVLDDSRAVMSQAKLSDFDQVVVSAHLSQSGNAMVQSGDFIADTVSWDAANPQDLTITIDSVK